MSHSKQGFPSAPVRTSALKWKRKENERRRQFQLLTRVTRNGSKSSYLIKNELTSRRELISPCLGSWCFYSQYFRLVDQRRLREQVLGLCEEGFRDVATKVCIAPVFIGERVEGAELRWTHLQCVPACGSGFSLHQW